MANAFVRWFDERAPGMAPMYRKHMTEYYAPKNFNLWYYFGSLAILVLVNQIVTGIFLTMNYDPSAAGAFDSVQYIMRDVEWGWLIRYMHTTGASLFFVVVFLHMFRGIMYGSFKKPRELVWVLGMLIFLVLMAEAFMGYVLPWGNMSFWGAKVIVSLFGTIPVIGGHLVEWIMGDFLPADSTLNRFFALHVIALPLVLLLLVVLHLAALHEVGSNNPDGVDVKHGPKGNRWDALKPADGIPFHPYYTLKDLVGVGVFLIVAAFIIFFAPTFGGWFLEHDNSIAANNLLTPAQIKPVWYFTAFYAIVRMVPSFAGTAVWGVIAMFGSIAVLFALPWIDVGPVKSIRYRGTGYKVGLTVFVIAFLSLMLIGTDLTDVLFPKLFGADIDLTTWDNVFGRIMTLAYFGFFVFLWLYTHLGWEKTKPVPERVTTHD
ncbi:MULTISPECIES: cytochrome b [Rhodanobacter]|uniref:Cytochrome b n=2 Tax=Rhodanobacter TaxID=75309 RepID=A0A1I4BJ47_9GAMM|nr:cytochrome bc complex cytochrome b subunit [Rhodanobacter glycinis]QEE23846.1 cytochrome bc complex cytochrome b subunit [Rhodanobacter glycinis]SFK68197.1 ubiquinol-cytochrome c reductase cytochrome b subunit [Rhodanobacter glycinis]